MRGLVIPSVLVILWEAGSRAGVLPPDSTSRPSDIVRAFVQALADGSLDARDARASGRMELVGEDDAIALYGRLFPQPRPVA